jgi:hypothetical protein
MANYSIPNSTPATGRTLTRSSRRSKKRDNATRSFTEASRLVKAAPLQAQRLFNAQRSTLNIQCSIQTPGRWTLDVELWAFSFRRVKGAWWPSRSSKPLSSRLAGGGRFDSYPLRRFFYLVILSGTKGQSKDPVACPSVPHRDSSTSLGVTGIRERR